MSLIAVASPSYHDDGGTPDPSDDLDYTGLLNYLRAGWAQVESIEHEMKPGRPRRQGTMIHVPIQFASRYKIAGKWGQKTDTMELVLERRDGKLLIVSGM